MYFISTSHGICQNLILNIYGIDSNESQIIDSLSYIKTHKNYQSLSSEIDSIQKKLLTHGYIENEISKVQKENDSSFTVKISLKKHYNNIYIYYKKDF